MKTIAALALSCAIAVSLICTASADAKIVTPKLSDLIKASEYIVRGKVSRLLTVSNAKVAEIEVVEVLKGVCQMTRLYFLASPTWGCDISDARSEESGLYFLSRPVESWRTESFEKLHPGFRQGVQSAIQGQVLYSIAWDGYGRFNDSKLDKLEVPESVEFPKSVGVKYLRKSAYHTVGLVEAADIYSLISLANKNGI